MKNYIWDFDGTLYDSYPVMMQALMETLTAFHKDLSKETVYRRIKKESIHQLIQEEELTNTNFDKDFHRLEKSYLNQAIPFEDTRETLQQLKQRGGRHFILTHRRSDDTWDLLKRDGLADYVEAIIGSESGFPRKPDPTAINQLIEEFHLDRHETVMIGDRKLDILAGKNADIATVFFDLDQFEEVPANFVVNNLRKLVSIF
ncbi:HAD-IA family hydrolase [Enterococcus alishanensis]|uniref:HAD-IA family hydrolase n=1 Tax=Enterococcus alishanensis TaxID=1303817 RepID=A0ABS6TBQ3_9ENTE|nr:HAD-IA family hydrolase [Enterococcus alishanensis]MBV7390338.1 HAD-IA family hydrolase [Enterococcus alishanensis]